MSEFHVRVIRVDEIQPHPNADRMEIVMVDGGYPVCVKKGEYAVGDSAVYLPVDSIVPDVDYYRFLSPVPLPPDAPLPERHRRIKAKKLRGVFSMGMLVPMSQLQPPEQHTRKTPKVWPPESGTNVQDLMGIEKWDPEVAIEGGPEANADGMTAKRRAYARLPWYRKPLSQIFWGRLRRDIKRRLGLAPVGFSSSVPGPGNFPEYTDIESLRQHPHWLLAGEEVVATEKVHGANFRCGWTRGKFWVGSHHQFKLQPLKGQKTDVFWSVAIEKDLSRLLAPAPEIAFFGEVYGAVQAGFGYDAPGKLGVRFFDAMDLTTHRWLDYDEFEALCSRLGLATVPVLFRGPWEPGFRTLAEGRSLIGSHIREGFVVKPVRERRQPHGARVILKMVGEEYLLRAA